MQLRGEGFRERARWSSCGLIVGLIVGIFLGWIFHGLVGTLVRIAIILLFLVPLVAAIVFYLSSRRGGGGGGGSSSVQEANWRNLNDAGDRRP